MAKTIAAIANYRVSSDEQLHSSSLARQEKVCIMAASKLGTTIVKSWSGSVSSKAGTNITRKDLLEMLDFCKQNKNVKFAIFDEYDRYMRSVNEGAYFEVLFAQLGVKVWYASESDTFNGNDAMAKFMRSMSAFKAEGSNEERQRKSIAGQTNALKDGRYTFSPKPGYQRGSQRGIQEVHPVRGPALKKVLLRVANRQVTPSQGLVELNNSPFMLDHKKYRMDKFRKILTDPFYAGIVEIQKQVQHRNLNGKHEPLITIEQHNTLLKIMDKKAKNQSGPRKNGNPKYPLNNIVSCDSCSDKKNNRYVGFNTNNGKNKERIYEKYRCRACYHSFNRDELHFYIEQCFKDHPITADGVRRLNIALDVAWKEEEAQSAQNATRTNHKIEELKTSIEAHVSALTEPRNASIKDELLAAIAKKKQEVIELENQLEKLTLQASDNKEQFLEFAFDFVKNMGSNFLEITHENRLRCKQVVFPAGFHIDSNGKVYTPEISTLITLQANKKDLPETEKSFMVRVQGL